MEFHSVSLMEGMAAVRLLVSVLLLAIAVRCYSPPPLRQRCVLGAVDKKKSDLTEAYLKVKRIKQLSAEGRNYTTYLDESSRLRALLKSDGSESNSTREMEIREKIVNYKENTALQAKERGVDVVFLPDCSVNSEDRLFYEKLMTDAVPGLSIRMNDMPNVHELNTKRYEFQWITYMRGLGLGSSDSAEGSRRQVLLAHGTSSEAVLRYLETDSLRSLHAVVLVDAPVIYTAGERHGRAFLYSRITAHAKSIRLVALSEKALNEAKSIVEGVSNLGYNCDETITLTACVDESVDSVLSIIRNVIKL